MRYMISFQCESNEEAQAVLKAVATIGKEPHACSKQYVEPADLGERRVLDEPVDSERRGKAFEVKDETRMNVTPGTPTITKIGTNTKEEIMRLLKSGVQPGAKYTEHLKLLWSRGEIKYDSVLFYI